MLALANLACEGEIEAAWLDDLDAARQIAAESDRLLVVHFSLPGRPLSDAMASSRESLTRTRVEAPPVLCHLLAEEHPEPCRELAGGGVGLATCFWHPEHGVLAVLRGHASAADLHRTLASAQQAVDALAADGVDELERGRRLYELGAVHRAETHFRTALDDAAQDAHAVRSAAHDWLARTAAEQGDLVTARHHLDQVRRHPGRRTANHHLATALVAFSARDPKDALRGIRRARRAAPDPLTGHHLTWLLGCTYHELGRDTEAVEALVSLASEGPRRWRTRARQQLEHMAQDEHTHDH